MARLKEGRKANAFYKEYERRLTQDKTPAFQDELAALRVSRDAYASSATLAQDESRRLHCSRMTRAWGFSPISYSKSELCRPKLNLSSASSTPWISVGVNYVLKQGAPFSSLLAATASSGLLLPTSRHLFRLFAVARRERDFRSRLVGQGC